MTGPLLVALVAFGVFLWVRGTRRNRSRWLRQLNLPGEWASAQGETLRLQGEFEHGTFSGSMAGLSRGRWTLTGHMLELVAEPSGEVVRYELTQFAPGQIGLEHPGKQRILLEKRPSNVVPLQRR